MKLPAELVLARKKREARRAVRRGPVAIAPITGRYTPGTREKRHAELAAIVQATCA